MLILARYVATHELGPLSRYVTLDDVLEGARKVQKGLAQETKPPVKGFRFFKVRIGARNSGRMIVFLATENQKVVPVLIRLKKDKIFGMNMAMNNPRVVQQMKKNMDTILDDIQNKNYEEFPL